MFVGLCAGDGDKYFFRLGRVETSNEQQLSTIIISTSTTENLSIIIIISSQPSSSHNHPPPRLYTEWASSLQLPPFHLTHLIGNIITSVAAIFVAARHHGRFLSSIGSGKQQIGHSPMWLISGCVNKSLPISFCTHLLSCCSLCNS